jgi:hypothetical protein
MLTVPFFVFYKLSPETVRSLVHPFAEGSGLTTQKVYKCISLKKMCFLLPSL